MVLIQEDTFGENTTSSQGLIALCATKFRSKNIYSVVKSGQGLGFFSYVEFYSAEFPVLLINTMTLLLCTVNSKWGPQFKSLGLLPLKSGFCYLLTNLGLRLYVFSLCLFCPPFHVLLLKAVFSQATSVPDKATSYYYLRSKALQTLKIDKTENEKLSTCLFPVIISGFKPKNISLQLSQKGTMQRKEAGKKFLAWMIQRFNINRTSSPDQDFNIILSQNCFPIQKI